MPLRRVVQSPSVVLLSGAERSGVAACGDSGDGDSQAELGTPQSDRNGARHGVSQRPVRW